MSPCHAQKQVYFYTFAIHLGTRIEICLLSKAFGAHPASFPLGTGVLLPEVKWPGHEVHHLPISHAKVKNEWRYMSIPPVPSCPAQGELYFLFTLHGVRVLKTPAKGTAVVCKDKTLWIKRG
jgi:hypothetical protein